MSAALESWDCPEEMMAMERFVRELEEEEEA